MVWRLGYENSLKARSSEKMDGHGTPQRLARIAQLGQYPTSRLGICHSRFNNLSVHPGFLCRTAESATLQDELFGSPICGIKRVREPVVLPHEDQGWLQGRHLAHD